MIKTSQDAVNVWPKVNRKNGPPGPTPEFQKIQGRIDSNIRSGIGSKILLNLRYPKIQRGFDEKGGKNF